MAWPSSQSDKLPVLFFVLALRFGAAGAGGGAAASLAKRSALSRSVFARSAAAVDFVLRSRLFGIVGALYLGELRGHLMLVGFFGHFAILFHE